MLCTKVTCLPKGNGKLQNIFCFHGFAFYLGSTIYKVMLLASEPLVDETVKLVPAVRAEIY